MAQKSSRKALQHFWKGLKKRAPPSSVEILPASLCPRCLKIDLDAVFSTHYFSHEYSPETAISALGLAENWSINSCDFCKLLAKLIVPPKRQMQTEGVYYLHAQLAGQLKNEFPLLQVIPETVVLQVYRPGDASFQGHLVSQTGAGPIRLLQTDKIDFDILRGWLQLCRDLHSEKCGCQDISCVPHLKLIDCETKSIVPALDNPYLTLSYIWGQDENVVPYSDQLPNDLPNTILDAMVVTRKLGFRYLWVDRYCINQQNKEQAYAQMRQMDSIYRYSEVTIVAAAGNDPSYGLPGMGNQYRNPQPHTQIGQHHVISLLQNAGQTVQRSKWASRGWTYQEALLSRRRIFFTSEQVYYECHGMSSHEVFDLPLQSMHTKDGNRLQRRYTPYASKYYSGKIGIFPEGVGNGPTDICERIQEYSKKSLTYQSDRLNAFLGILKAFETGTYSIRNLWGTPILPPHTPLTESESLSTHKPRLHSATEFVNGMCWQFPSSLGHHDRQHNLPNWSWVGWTGHVQYHLPDKFIQNPDVKVQVELPDGQSLDWDTFQGRYDELNNISQITPFIYISTWMIPIRLVERKNVCHFSEVDMEDGYYVEFHFHARTEEPIGGLACSGLLLSGEGESGIFPGQRIFIIIVREVDGVMQRVGSSLLSVDTKLFNCDGSVVSAATGQPRKSYALTDRYGENWHLHLKSTYKTIRLG